MAFLVFNTALNRGQSLEYAQTLAFSTLIFAQVWHIFDARASFTLFSKDPFGNRMLLMALALSTVLSLLAIYSPPGEFVMGTVPLSFRHLLEAIFIAGLPTLVLSGLKEVFGFRFL